MNKHYDDLLKEIPGFVFKKCCMMCKFRRGSGREEYIICDKKGDRLYLNFGCCDWFEELDDIDTAPASLKQHYEELLLLPKEDQFIFARKHRK